MHEIEQLLWWLCYTEQSWDLEISVEKPIYFLKEELMLPIYLAQIIETEEEKQKMERLYDKYERLLYCVAFNYLKDAHRAEDAVHDTYLKIVDRLDSIDEIDSPRTKRYLVTITEHICINMMKRKSYKTEINGLGEKELIIAETTPSTYDNTEDIYFEKFDVAEIKAAISGLPQKLQNTLILYAVEGYSMKELAELDDCSVEAVKKRVQRARAKIIEALQVV